MKFKGLVFHVVLIYLYGKETSKVEREAVEQPC